MSLTIRWLCLPFVCLPSPAAPSPANSFVHSFHLCFPSWPAIVPHAISSPAQMSIPLGPATIPNPMTVCVCVHEWNEQKLCYSMCLNNKCILMTISFIVTIMLCICFDIKLELLRIVHALKHTDIHSYPQTQRCGRA